MYRLLGTKEYTVRFDEDTGLTIGLRQRGGLNRGVLGTGRDSKGAVNQESTIAGNGSCKDEGGVSWAGGEQTIVFEVPPELRAKVKTDSVLLAVNNIEVGNCKK